MINHEVQFLPPRQRFISSELSSNILHKQHHVSVFHVLGKDSAGSVDLTHSRMVWLVLSCCCINQPRHGLFPNQPCIVGTRLQTVSWAGPQEAIASLAAEQLKDESVWFTMRLPSMAQDDTRTISSTTRSLWKIRHSRETRSSHRCHHKTTSGVWEVLHYQLCYTIILGLQLQSTSLLCEVRTSPASTGQRHSIMYPSTNTD